MLFHHSAIEFSLYLVLILLEPHFGQTNVGVLVQIPPLTASSCSSVNSMPSFLAKAKSSFWDLHAFTLAICSSVKPFNKILYSYPKFSFANNNLMQYLSQMCHKTKPPPSFLERGIGGSNEDRTRYLIVANDVLSQMSYGPVFWLAVNIISLFL